MFQSTRPRGARRAYRPSISSIRSFNPRAHAGRDRFVHWTKQVYRVSIHAPTRGATSYFFQVMKKSFNPRAHAGRDRFGSAKISLACVSIHAPTRGATFNHVIRESVAGVSIHAPTRGATDRGRLRPKAFKVSIHAPTRGATSTPQKNRFN